MAVTPVRYRIYMFPVNSPWGVIKHPQRGNVYRHIINFPTDKRNEFVKKYLNKNNNLTDSDFINYSIVPINELSFRFNVPIQLDTNITELSNRDFCVIKKPNETRYYYYTLSVINTAGGFIQFAAELDIFFTYSINELLDDKRESVISRGHIKRYKTDGSIDWDKVLQNKEPLAPINKLIKTHELNATNSTNKLKWAVMYIKRDQIEDVFQGYGNKSLSSEVYFNLKTMYCNNELPYVIIVFPYVNDLIVRDIYIKEGTKASYEYVRDFFNYITTKKGDAIIAIHLKDFNELGINLEKFGVKTVSGTKIGSHHLITITSGAFNFWEWRRLKSFNKTWENFLDDSSTHKTAYNNYVKAQVDYNTNQGTKSDLNAKYEKLMKLYKAWNDKYSGLLINQGFFVVKNIEDGGFYPSEMSILADELQPFKETIKDPILYHNNHYKLTIKKWNTERKDYTFPRLALEPKGTKRYTLRNVYTFNPITDKNVFWMEYDKKYQNSLLESDYLELTNKETVETAQDSYLAYLRDNKNAFNTSYENQKAILKMNRNLSVIGITASTIRNVAGLAAPVSQTIHGLTLSNGPRGIASGISGIGSTLGGIPSGALAFGALRNIDMRLSHLDNMRKATINDLKNRPDNVTTGETSHLSGAINYYEKTKDDIQLLEYGVDDYTKKLILDYVARYGYEVGTVNNVKNFVQTRKRLNYIEADDVFNDIKLDLSPRVKQTISDAFQNGLFIWHYRNEQDWKGIKNFTDDNNEYVPSDDNTPIGPIGQPGGND